MTQTSTRRPFVVLSAAAMAGAALTGCSTSSAPLCDTDASCAALGIGTGYGVTTEMVAAQLPAGCVSAYTGQPGEDPTVAWCGPVFVAEATATPGEWSCLRGLGYVGSPLDGVEALYADGSDVAECSPHAA